MFVDPNIFLSAKLKAADVALIGQHSPIRFVTDTFRFRLGVGRTTGGDPPFPTSSDSHAVSNPFKVRINQDGNLWIDCRHCAWPTALRRATWNFFGVNADRQRSDNITLGEEIA